MANNIYLHTSSAGSGLSVIAFGLMEQLTGLGVKPCVFIPVSDHTAESHPILTLFTQRYPLPFTPQQLIGCSGQQARTWIAEGKQQQLLKVVLAQYKLLEDQCDIFLIPGPQLAEDHSMFDSELSVELANNLNSTIIGIINGSNSSANAIIEAVRIQRETLQHHGGEVSASIVNKVSATAISELSHLPAFTDSHQPLFLLADEPMLSLPTIGEVSDALHANWLHGNTADRQREINGYKVAAMEMPNFLHHLEDGDLIITPGDRADIILSSLLAHESNRYPHLAGLLLTGGILPADTILELVAGLRRMPLPIVTVTTDTYDTIVNVLAVQPGLCADNSRKIAAAIGVVEAAIDRQWLQQQLTEQQHQRMTPLVFEYELIRNAKAIRQHIVLPEASDERILRAAEILLLRDVCTFTLLGEEKPVREKIAQLGLQLDGITIIDPATSPLRDDFAEQFYQLRQHKGVSLQSARDTIMDVNYFGTMMVYTGMADGMVSGAAHTTQQTIRPAFEIIKTQPGRNIISSVFLMCLEDRVLVYGDCAVNPNPDAGQLADIAIASAETARRFGIEPRVAMLSYSTGDSGKGSEVDKVRAATQKVRQLYPELMIDGPIQYDAAVDKSVALSKLPSSSVAGTATVFIFPDLNTGNNTYKAVQRSADAVAIGPVLQGLNKPVNDLSRGCSVTDIVNTIAITAIQAQSSGKT